MITPGDDILIEVSITKDSTPYDLTGNTNMVFEVWQFKRKVFTVPSADVTSSISSISAIVNGSQTELLEDAGMAVKVVCELPDTAHEGNTNKMTFNIENPTVQSIGGSAIIYNTPISKITLNGVAAAKAGFAVTMTIRALFSGVAAAKANLIGRISVQGQFNGVAAADASISPTSTVKAVINGLASAKASFAPTAEFNKAASAYLWLETDANVSLSSGDFVTGGQVDGWDDQSDNGFTFSQSFGANQLDYIPNGFGTHAVIGTTAFASQIKSLVTDEAKSSWNFLHDGTTPFTIFMIKQGYDGSSYTDADLTTVYNANAGAGPGFIVYRANRAYIKSATLREGAAGGDGNSGYKLFYSGFKDDGAGNKDVFSQVHGGVESVQSMDSFSFDASDSQYDLFLGGRNGGGSRSALVAIVIVKDPSAVELSEWTSYLTTKYSIT